MRLRLIQYPLAALLVACGARPPAPTREPLPPAPVVAGVDDEPARPEPPPEPPPPPEPLPEPPPPEPPPPAPIPIAGERHLAGLHPELAKRARLLHRRAAQAGIELRFISGRRKLKPRRLGWHQFGLAVDLNLAHRRDMKDALRHYEEDRWAWRQVGAIAEDLGLIWGLSFRRSEVFHFEWHPGYPAAFSRKLGATFMKHIGPKRNVEAVWDLLAKEE